MSRLFNLCKFNLVVHTKCRKEAFCIDYGAKFTEVKQERKVKPEGVSVKYGPDGGGWRMADGGQKNADDKMQMTKCR